MRPPAPVQITKLRRYPNRRLYDSRRSRYVTLDEVAEMIAVGERILVTDATTGRDVTRSVLLKVLLLDESGGQRLFVRLHKCPLCESPLSPRGIGKTTDP